MKKLIVITIFIIGLGIFSYPIISNLFATKEHHSTISGYNEAIKQMEADEIALENAKIATHNEALAGSEIDFVDPFSENESDESLGKDSYYDALNINPAIGSITISKINVEMPIYHGTSEAVLSRGVGHLENSSLPSGDSGIHSVLTAHRGLPSSKLFRDLDKLEIGDQFSIQVLDEKLTYEIHEVNIVLPHETAWLQINEDENVVTLLTCEPYMINTHRMLVTGHLVPNGEENDSLNESNGRIFLYVAIALVLSGILAWVWMFLQRKKGRKTYEEE